MINLEGMKKIGLLGGTFDPIHYGHLALAQEALHAHNLDTVVFMPTGSPPHKTGNVISDAEHRFEMCVAATSANPQFTVSRLEIDRTGHSYTIDTINEFQKKYPGAEIFFIMGADMVFDIENWKDAQTLLTCCSFIAATRSGHSDIKRITKEAKKLEKKYGAKVYPLEIPGMDISSSALRVRVLNGEPIRYLVPVRVERHITMHDLYKVDEQKLHLNAIKQTLQQELGEKRFAHTLGVCETAVRLADVYGANKNKAYIAALLHDCARSLNTTQQLAYCEEHGIILDAYMQNEINPVHALIGAHMAKHRFGIKNKQVLTAIERHVIGSKKMGLLDKIIFVADAIEPNRAGYNDLEEARRIAESDLNTALILALNIKTAFLKSPLHPTSVKMLKNLEEYT